MSLPRQILSRVCRRGISTGRPVSPPPRRSRRFYIATFAAGAAAGIAYYNFTPAPPSRLNPDTFTPYTLASHTPISTRPTETSLLTLSPPAGAAPPPFSPTHVQSVEIKHPQVQIARHYTPLPPAAEGDAAIRLLVKREPAGEMSRYLFALATGATVELRGPHEEYALPPPDAASKLLFLAGGTGIAPALQAAYKLLENSAEAEARVLWAVRHRGESQGAAAAEVERLQARYPGRLEVEVCPDPEGGMKPGTVSDGVQRWGADRIVVCGPDGFVAYWAGPRGPWVGGREQQGELGGVLGGLVEGREVEVWKMS
ncbi:hypothetical protein FN846DRAFT_277151 [Sphaerosporella brunnea]|uniref:FAD-binding FR-type domain-containing protein n=1 Tax=Sphaerosporella brunnea TaxID=1250544 RepID=A0A5J5EM71_9PEZI|nr:hypothetical protein FN846DRAFT_277151 [Sphaerosporella brunnea]